MSPNDISKRKPNVSNNDLVQKAPGEDVTDKMLREDVNNPNSWLYYNKGPEETGYSPASQITSDNVDSLGLEYTIDDYDGSENNPIVVPGDPPVLYYSRTQVQQVTAVNARTGEKYWSSTYENEDTQGITYAHRGVAVRGDKVYFGSFDNHIVALDRYTGEQQWKTSTFTPKQRKEMGVPERMGNTQASIAFNGMVFNGMSGGRGGWGAYSAVDAESGDIVWQQTVVPEDEWVGETWRYGDSAPWHNATAIDPESGMIFIPGGNPGPRYNAVVRPGPNKHSDSVIALDTKSGEVQWTTQLVAHDQHDMDMYSTRIIEMKIDGQRQRVIEAINKTGFLYFLDIDTGKIIERSEPYAKQGGEVPFLGMLPKGEENKATVWPSDRGATDWTPDSFSPKTGLVYIAANNTAKKYWYEDFEYNADMFEPSQGGGNSRVDVENHPDISRYIAAIDPATGEVVWKHSVRLDVESRASTGGTTATAGNVLFSGTPKAVLIAVDAESGERLWEHKVSNQPGAITAAPVTWLDEKEDKQYVAIASADGIQAFTLKN